MGCQLRSRRVTFTGVIAVRSRVRSLYGVDWQPRKLKEGGYRPATSDGLPVAKKGNIWGVSTANRARMRGGTLIAETEMALIRQILEGKAECAFAPVDLARRASVASMPETR